MSQLWRVLPALLDTAKNEWSVRATNVATGVVLEATGLTAVGAVETLTAKIFRNDYPVRLAPDDISAFETMWRGVALQHVQGRVRVFKRDGHPHGDLVLGEAIIQREGWAVRAYGVPGESPYPLVADLDEAIKMLLRAMGCDPAEFRAQR